MLAGKMDRQIILQALANTRDTTGATVQAWTDLATVWAEVRPLRASESIAAQQVDYEADTIFRIRFRSDVTPTTRISYSGVIYDIVSIAELGRQDGLEITATARRV